MLRAIAVVIALIGCVLAGCSGANRLRRRHVVLVEISMAVERIRLGLAHTNQSVAVLLTACGGQETQKLFDSMARNVKEGDTPLIAWAKASQNGDAALSCLEERDRKTLCVFFSLLGGSDRHSQLQHVDATRKALSMQCTEACRAYEKNGRMFRTLGVLLGIGAAVLLL